MPKLTRDGFYDLVHGERIAFQYEVYVTTDGEFTTTIPEEVAAEMLSDGLSLARNRSGRMGFFSASTMKGLKLKIKETVHEWKSRELISERVVLEYCIETTASFFFDEAGQPVPNGYWVKDRKQLWQGGTRRVDSCNCHPYGIQVYVAPLVERTYRYRSGREIVEDEYRRRDERFGGESSDPLDFLSDIICQDVPDRGKLHRIEYSEVLGFWFVDLIKGICLMAHKVAQFVNPASILELAEGRVSLLAAPQPTEAGE